MRFLIFIALAFLAINADAKFFKKQAAPKTLASYLPQFVKGHLPKLMLDDLQKLTLKDVDAARKVVERWPEFSNMEAFEKIVGEESKPLKNFVDDVITVGHQSIDATVAKMSEGEVKFFQQAGKVVSGAREQLVSLYKNEKPEIKDSLKTLFPRIHLLVDHPQILQAPISYCGLGNLLGGNGAGDDDDNNGVRNNAQRRRRAQQVLAKRRKAIGKGLRRLLGYQG
ncbi:hypothetical protein M3Y97_00644100 [Aphelenchoides bicaudatus]|nr:hypothetical protein M3Y97_00644100 [Aphelenchoides bicaudatus]